jgi:hypothetical protein
VTYNGLEIGSLTAERELFMLDCTGRPVDDRDDEPSKQDTCAHKWVFTGIAYGGDDESYHGEGRCYCTQCGADGDA